MQRQLATATMIFKACMLADWYAPLLFMTTSLLSDGAFRRLLFQFRENPR